MKLRVQIKPHRSSWKWTIEGWYTAQQVTDLISYRDEAVEGWYYVIWAIPHDWTEYNRFEGEARNEEKARSAARKALHDAAGRLAVDTFDKGLGRQQGYVVEV